MEFLGYLLHEYKHFSLLSAFKSFLQILVKVIEKNLWHSYISIFGIYNDSKQSHLELSYVALKNLEILTKVLEINFMAGGFSDEVRRHIWYECPNWTKFWQKSLQSMVFCYFLSPDVLPLISKASHMPPTPPTLPPPSALNRQYVELDGMPNKII